MVFPTEMLSSSTWLQVWSVMYYAGDSPGAFAFYKIPLSFYNFQFLYYFIALSVFTLGLSWFFSAVNVFYRMLDKY
jgi:ABC-type polysaccharide/polyol phosphate export permease